MVIPSTFLYGFALKSAGREDTALSTMNDAYDAYIRASATRLRTKRGFRRIGKSESRLPNESPNLHPIFLCERWNDTVQAQVLD
jgi:hypothetical protein